MPRSITVDHGTEFMSRALEDWAYRRGLQLDFIRPGKPMENAFIESSNGRLRDECLNVQQFTSLDDAKAEVELWRLDYNEHRPRGSLGHLTPNEFVAQRQITEARKKRPTPVVICLVTGERHHPQHSTFKCPTFGEAYALTARDRRRARERNRAQASTFASSQLRFNHSFFLDSNACVRKLAVSCQYTTASATPPAQIMSNRSMPKFVPQACSM